MIIVHLIATWSINVAHWQLKTSCRPMAINMSSASECRLVVYFCSLRATFPSLTGNSQLYLDIANVDQHTVGRKNCSVFRNN